MDFLKAIAAFIFVKVPGKSKTFVAVHSACLFASYLTDSDLRESIRSHLA